MRTLKIASMILTLTALAAFALAPAALAHDMWGAADNPTVGQPLKATIGYGHHYPKLEDIPAEEVPFFQVYAVGPDGKIDLTQGSPNYSYASKDNLAKATYLVIADVKPIYWSRTTGGEWNMKRKDETPGATECGLYIEGAKGIIPVDGDTTATVATKAQGLPIEIVPLAHPGTVKPGQKLVLQVLYQGKPLPGAEVKGRYDGFASLVSDTAQAYMDTTDQDGKVTFVPLAAGEWIVTARNKTAYEGPGTCDNTDYGTSLHFAIK
ncbi:MAG: DUF4198 domain-containing protein [Deltaproteobacteria bacterium]|jgi:uncharacterized GH25 family protein|nr:DUF4198 domain-containing protein [Deltaproteobacteria bacterium]